MSNIDFRTLAPARNYSGKTFSDYKKYKPFLAKDFNDRCGYTDCPHFWFGGTKNFQIDHFKPKSRHPHLTTTYSNLIYSCSYVNRAKSNDDGNFIDPCNTDYNTHFYRDTLGNIYPSPASESAKYMYKKLKLYLKRYGIIYTIEKLQNQLTRLRGLIEKTDNQEAKDLYIQVSFKFHDYLKYLSAEQ
jgi:uncharacterized protein (TIGR02646 family)